MKIKQKRFVRIFPVLVAGLGCGFLSACLAVADTPGTMNVARAGHTATLLPGGKVLVAGGAEGDLGSKSEVASAELFDPVHGTWTMAHAMNAASAAHLAILLLNGKVLVVGGSLAGAELYDPASDRWTATGSMGGSPASATATLLPDGKVLVAGGVSIGGELHPLASTEIFDPATGNWTATGSLNTPRFDQVAVLLPNGKVLVAGGEGELGKALSSAELFDPNTGKWTATGAMADVREYATATLLPNGKVLVVGGLNQGMWNGRGKAEDLSRAELYDPATGKWTATSEMKDSRFSHTAILLRNGKVLVWGGTSIRLVDTPLANPPGAELYDPHTGQWTKTQGMSTSRWGYGTTLLSNGKVLVTGGIQFVLHKAGKDESLASAPMLNDKGHKIGEVRQSNDMAKIITFSSTELYDPATGIWTASE